MSKVPAALCTCQHMVLPVFVILAVVMGVWQYYIIDLAFVSLMNGQLGTVC